MYQDVGGESRAVHVPLDENLLVGIALTRKSVEARSMLVWGEHCTECVMPSCYASCALYMPRQDLKCRRFDQGIVPVRTSSSGEVPAMRVSFRKWEKLEAEGRLSAVSLQRRQALTIAARSLRWNAAPRSPGRRPGSRRCRTSECAPSVFPMALNGTHRKRSWPLPAVQGTRPFFSFMPAATRSEWCRTCGIGSHSMPAP
jgi:hypothetical protein